MPLLFCAPDDDFAGRGCGHCRIDGPLHLSPGREWRGPFHRRARGTFCLCALASGTTQRHGPIDGPTGLAIKQPRPSSFLRVAFPVVTTPMRVCFARSLAANRTRQAQLGRASNKSPTLQLRAETRPVPNKWRPATGALP